MVQELQAHLLYTYLKDVNNHNSFLALSLVFIQFQGNSVIM